MTDPAFMVPPTIGRASGLLGEPIQRTLRRGPICRTLGHVRLIAGPTTGAAATVRDGDGGPILVKLVAGPDGMDAFSCGFRIRSGLWLELTGEGAEVLAYYVG